MVLGNFGSPAQNSELDILRKEKLCPLIPSTQFTNISTRSPQGNRCLDNIWLSRSLKKIYSGKRIKCWVAFSHCFKGRGRKGKGPFFKVLLLLFVFFKNKLNPIFFHIHLLTCMNKTTWRCKYWQMEYLCSTPSLSRSYTGEGVVWCKLGVRKPLIQSWRNLGFNILPKDNATCCRCQESSRGSFDKLIQSN